MTPGTVYIKSNTPADATDAMHMTRTPYHKVIGSLMYTAVATCPNISFAVSTLSQFLNNPGCAH